MASQLPSPPQPSPTRGEGGAPPPRPSVPAALLPDVLENIPEAVIGVDHRGHIFYWNRGAEALFGWTAEEVLGRRLDRLHIWMEDTRGGRHLPSSKWKSQREKTEWKCISKSGQRLSLKVKVLPMSAEHRPEPDGPSESGGWLIIGQDVTEARQAERRAAQLAVIHAIMRQIGTTHDLNAVAQTVAEALHEHLGFSRTTVLWLDQDAQELVLAAHRALSDPAPADYRQKISVGVMGRAVRTRQPQLVRDTRHDPDYVASSRPRRSELCVPIQHGDEVLGVINLENERPGAFDQDDLESVQTIANALALALENAWWLKEGRRASEELKQRIQARTRELNAVRKTLLDITAQLDLPQVLYAIAKRAADLVSAKGGLIELLDAERNELEYIASYGIERDYTGWRLALGEGLSGRVAASGQPIIVDNYQTWEGRAAIYAGEPFTALAGVPLEWQGQVIGVLSVVDDSAERTFTQEDVRRLMLLAPQAAIAVRNAQLYADAQAKAERLAVINALDRAIHQGSLDLRQLFETFAAQAGRLLPYDRMSLALLEGDQYHLLAVEPGLSPGIGRELWLPRQGTSFDWAIEHNQTLVRPDITQPPHFSTDALLIPAGVRSTVVVPLVARGRALGTWNMARRQPHAFSPEEIGIFETVAGQLAIALDNVRLHQDLAAQAARLRQAYSQLEQADRLKNEMIQNISHELRMPLTIVRGYLELILDGALGEVPPGLEEPLRTASRRADEIVEIVERITTLHGLRLGGLEMERLSLSTLVQQAASIAQRAAQSAGLTLQVALPGDELYVQGNAEQLLQVLGSLLDNAIKFNQPGGHILVTVKEDNGLVAVEVTDTGIGIPADKLDQVWDPFYQVDGSTTRRYGGMGVGLALVKEVIEAHGGAVWARSTEGQGSTFGFGLRRSL